jgi:AcrR family transcriptional regulator
LRQVTQMGDHADRRVARSKAAILDACAALLSEQGFAGVTVEAVAARSGAAKTTIYRHWPSREALLVDAFGTCAGPSGGACDTGVLREDLRALLLGLAGALREAVWCAALPSLVDAAARDPELARLHERVVAERRAPLMAAIARGVARGELPPDTDAGAAVAMLAGPLFYRHMISREPVDEAFVTAVLDGALAGLRAGRAAPGG